MLDTRLRPTRERLVQPFVASPLGRVSPIVLTALGLALSLAAAGAASQQLIVLSVVLWLAGRICDGLDGAVARANGLSSERGAVIDIVADTIAYAAIPVGLAIGVDTRAAWIATAVVLGSFYVNSVSLGYVAALVERRNVRRPDELTALAVPHGLIEGAETIVFFTLALALPDVSHWIWTVMAVLVLFTAIDRVVRAIGADQQ